MTHENEYFRSLAHQLNTYHSEKNTQDLHVLIANLSVNGHQLDALYIAHGQITVIDFKDYGGQLSFSENGQWSMDSKDSGTVFVSGGARMRNPFQQVRAYKYSLLEFLSTRAEAFIGDNHDVDLGHISAFVNFQQPIKHDKSSIPRNAERWFKVTDVNDIISSLDDRHSEKLNLSDDEIQKLITCLGIDESMVYDPEIAIDEPVQSTIDPGRLSIILKQMVDTQGWEPSKKLLQYYLTLVRAERYKASDLINKMIAEHINVTTQHFQIKLENYPEFLSAFIEDGAQQWSKDVFVGINAMIGTSLVPLFYKVISRSSVNDSYTLEIDKEDIELYVPSLEKMQLADDILESIQSKLATAKTIDDKIDAIREELDTVVELSSSVTLALHQEGLYSAQLMSELRKLVKSDLSEKSLFHHILLNKPLQQNQSTSLPKPQLRVSPLNTSQKRAVALAFNQPISVITGPPGTGKSQVVLNIMANALYNDVKCLFVSRNHKAVDTVNERFAELIDSPYLLKFAGSRSIEDEVKPAISALTNRMQTIEDSIANKFSQQSVELKELLRKNSNFISLPEEIKSLREKTLENKKEVESTKKALDEIGDNYPDWGLLIAAENKLNYRESEFQNLESQVQSYPSGFLGNLFGKSKKNEIENKLIRFRESLPAAIDEIIDKESPLHIDGQNFTETASDFLNKVHSLKIKQVHYQKKISSAKNKLDKVESTYENSALHLKNSEKNLERLSTELEDFDNKHLAISKEVLKSLVDYKISAANGDALISYRDFLPAKNVWQHNELKSWNKLNKEQLSHLNSFLQLVYRYGMPLP
tara:strand:- start:25386 stop:27830 length:2445 start_codon:yes stop_codon:yes gene_type:complete